MATQGTEQWAGVVAKAMTAGGMDHGKSMQALQAFKTAVAAKMAKTVRHIYSPSPLLLINRLLLGRCIRAGCTLILQFSLHILDADSCRAGPSIRVLSIVLC